MSALQRRGSSGTGTPGSPLHRATSAAAGAAGPLQSDVYLTELLSYSLDRLRKEPELLAAEQQQLQRTLQSNAVTHYQAFLGAADCLATIADQLEAVTAALGRLAAAVPGLSATCDAFSKDAAGVIAKQARTRQVLGQQAVLLELLEAPALMDTCVRNGVYDEPLDLAAALGRLALLHPDLPVVGLLQQQAAAVSHTMLQQLLGRLRAPLALPECLRVVGYLRRLGAFPEPQLRLVFLACREAWFGGVVGELEEGDSGEYVKALTDAYRLQLFEVVMQYRAVFFDRGDDRPELAFTGSTPGASSSSSSSRRDSAALHSWVAHRMQLYMAALAAHLPRVSEGGTLAAVLEHVSYCGTSLSRVGLDVSGLLQPVAQAVAVQLFSSSLAAAVEGFQSRLDSHKWVPLPAPVLGKARAAAAAAAAGEGGSGSADGSGGAAAGGGSRGAGGEDMAPPYVLMEHVPLAVFTNGVLAALNELRHCALLALQQPLAGRLNVALEQVAGALVLYRHSHPLGDSEAPLFRAAASALSDVVVPFVAVCFGRVFPGASGLIKGEAVAEVLQEVLSDS